MIRNFINSLIAEVMKLKHTVIPWLVLLGGFIVAVFFFLDYNFGVVWQVNFEENPWDRLYGLSRGLFCTFIATPLLVLIVTSLVQLEHRSNSWKNLYALPLAKGDFHFSKLLLCFLLFIFSMLIYILAIYIDAKILNWNHPEYEFNFFKPDFRESFKVLSHLIIACSGIIGFQYWLSLRFKNFIIPIGIGITLFIVGLIVSIVNTKYALYFPFCYPFIFTDLQMFSISEVPVVSKGILNNVEIFSLIYFCFFTALSYFGAIRRNVS